MSANVEVLHRSEVIGSVARETALPQPKPAGTTNRWDPEDFAREQIRGLVRQVFFAGETNPVKQVVFSAAEPHIDVVSICNRVATTLAFETCSQVALLECELNVAGIKRLHVPSKSGTSIKSRSMQLGGNLWRVSKNKLSPYSEDSGTGLHWISCLAELRDEFEYVVIQGPAAGISSEAATLGQLTDGIVLVLGAHSTRRAAARKIKQTLEAAHARILGTVLSERTFPIPEQIYRRL